MAGDVVVLCASIDAGKSQKGVHAVAGVAFGYDNQAKANAKWERLMDGRVFHMTDLNARRNHFSGISDSEVVGIMKGIVDIIRCHASFIVAVSCQDDLISEPLPNKANRDRDSEEMRNIFRSSYGCLGHICMWKLGKFANQSRPDKKQISYVLEHGDIGQNGLVRFMRHIENSHSPEAEVLRQKYSYNQLRTAEKGQMPGILHASDFIAWEWGRHIERVIDSKSMRKSLQCLIGTNKTFESHHGFTLVGENRFFLRHFNQQNMDRVAAHLRRFIEAESDADMIEAYASWEASRP